MYTPQNKIEVCRAGRKMHSIEIKGENWGHPLLLEEVASIIFKQTKCMESPKRSL